MIDKHNFRKAIVHHLMRQLEIHVSKFVLRILILQAAMWTFSAKLLPVKLQVAP
jgi:hypothetical protein